MNLSQFEHLPPFIKREMESIAEKIQPLLKKNTTYFMLGFPLMLVGIINILMHFTYGSWDMSSILIPAVYALMSAIGVALFQESRGLKKQIHHIAKAHIVARIKQSDVMTDDKKNIYISSVQKQPKMDLQLFFKFLTEENRERQSSYF